MTGPHNRPAERQASDRSRNARRSAASAGRPTGEQMNYWAAWAATAWARLALARRFRLRFFSRTSICLARLRVNFNLRLISLSFS